MIDIKVTKEQQQLQQKMHLLKWIQNKEPKYLT